MPFKLEYGKKNRLTNKTVKEKIYSLGYKPFFSMIKLSKNTEIFLSQLWLNAKLSASRYKITKAEHTTPNNYNKNN